MDYKLNIWLLSPQDSSDTYLVISIHKPGNVFEI